MSRPPKDLVEFVATRTNRYILRILHAKEGLTAAEIGKELENTAKIRFKSTSSLAETLQRLANFKLVEKADSRYYLSNTAKERWLSRFLNVLIEEGLDKGTKVRLS